MDIHLAAPYTRIMNSKSFSVELNDEHEFQRLLPGESETCGMKAGRVYLEPGKSCGEHSTKDREEMLIFLAGGGIAHVGEESHKVGRGKVAYIPPETSHEIENTGSEPLIYIYCTAPAQE